MKIEEAKEAIKASSKAMTDINAIHSFGHIPCKQAIPVNDVINIIDQIELDQPKKEVPQMIFDVIESFDEDKDYLHQHMSRQPSEVREWLTHNERDFYEAWLAYPNITVEKEKLYTVKILGCTLFKMTSDNHVRYKLIGENETPSESKFSSYKFEADLTEQEIKQADERLWQFAKEVPE